MVSIQKLKYTSFDNKTFSSCHTNDSMLSEYYLYNNSTLNMM